MGPGPSKSISTNTIRNRMKSDVQVEGQDFDGPAKKSGKTNEQQLPLARDDDDDDDDDDQTIEEEEENGEIK